MFAPPQSHPTFADHPTEPCPVWHLKEHWTPLAQWNGCGSLLGRTSGSSSDDTSMWVSWQPSVRLLPGAYVRLAPYHCPKTKANGRKRRRRLLVVDILSCAVSCNGSSSSRTTTRRSAINQSCSALLACRVCTGMGWMPHQLGIPNIHVTMLATDDGWGGHNSAKWRAPSDNILDNSGRLLTSPCANASWKSACRSSNQFVTSFGTWQGINGIRPCASRRDDACRETACFLHNRVNGLILRDGRPGCCERLRQGIAL